MLLDNVDILKKFVKYFEEVILFKENEIIGVRYRKNGKGKMLFENENLCVRKIGFIVLVQRNIIERIWKNEVFVKKFKLNVFYRNLGECKLGQLFISDENVNMEEDDIYDEIFVMGILN